MRATTNLGARGTKATSTGATRTFRVTGRPFFCSLTCENLSSFLRRRFSYAKLQRQFCCVGCRTEGRVIFNQCETVMLLTTMMGRIMSGITSKYMMRLRLKSRTNAMGHHCHVKFKTNGGSEDSSTEDFPGCTSSNDFADSSAGTLRIAYEVPDSW